MTKLIETAPRAIWLQVSEDEQALADPFDKFDRSEVTWCDVSQMAAEVQYIRADLVDLDLDDIFERAIEQLKIFKI